MDENEGSRAKMSSSRIRRYLTVAVAVLVCALLLLVYFSGVLVPEETVKIGVIVPLTGQSAHLADIGNGMTLAVETLNRWGGINNHRIELILRDSGSDPNRSVELFGELERDEHPLVYVSAACSCTSPLTSLAEEYQVPLIGVATANLVGFEETGWTFRYFPGPEEEIATTMLTLESLGVTSLGIMRSDNSLGEMLTQVLTSEFEALGGTVETTTYCCKDEDIAAKAQSLADNEAIYIAGDFKATQAAILALDPLGYEGHVFASSVASCQAISSMQGAQGIYVSAPAMYNPNYLPAKALGEEYLLRFGAPMNHFAAGGYDVIYLLYGLLTDKELTRQSIHDELTGGFSFPSTLGMIRVAEGSHDIQYPLFEAQIVEGEICYL